MASCECCWNGASELTMHLGGSVTERYYEVMKDHEVAGCVCTKKGLAGDKARAGQFWVDGKDTR